MDTVAKLRAGLMSFAQRSDGAYTDEELLKCQALIVFSHAEVQVYLESVSRRILSEAQSLWNASATFNRVVGSLAAFRHPEQVSIPQDPKNPHRNGDIKKIIARAIETQNKVIGDNNGIKRANIAELLCPLGIMPDDLDEPFLIQLDQTGKRRGDMVHKSSRVSLRNIRDPFTVEQKDIDDLVTEIGRFDRKLEALGLLSVPQP